MEQIYTEKERENVCVDGNRMKKKEFLLLVFTYEIWMEEKQWKRERRRQQGTGGINLFIEI